MKEQQFNVAISAGNQRYGKRNRGNSLKRETVFHRRLGSGFTEIKINSE